MESYAPVVITPERIAALEAQSTMLGQIGMLVEGWCFYEDCSTLDAVKLALCDLEEMRARERRASIHAIYRHSTVD